MNVRRTNAILDTQSNSREENPPPIQTNCTVSNNFQDSLNRSVSRAVELFINQVQEKVDIELQCLLKQAHVLIIVELCAQAFLQRHLRARSWYLYASHAALDKKDTDLVTRDGEVDLVPLLLRVTLP